MSFAPLDIFALIAGLVGAAGAWKQMFTLFSLKTAKGVSLWRWVFMGAGGFLWILYAIGNNYPVQIFVNVVFWVAELGILWWLLRRWVWWGLVAVLAGITAGFVFAHWTVGDVFLTWVSVVVVSLSIPSYWFQVYVSMRRAFQGADFSAVSIPSVVIGLSSLLMWLIWSVPMGATSITLVSVSGATASILILTAEMKIRARTQLDAQEN